MPPCEKESYEKNLCIIWPAFGIPFLIWGLGLYNYIEFKYLLIGGEILIAVLIIIFYYTQRNLKENEVPSYVQITAHSSISTCAVLFCSIYSN